MNRRKGGSLSRIVRRRSILHLLAVEYQDHVLVRRVGSGPRRRFAPLRIGHVGASLGFLAGLLCFPACFCFLRGARLVLGLGSGNFFRALPLER